MKLYRHTYKLSDKKQCEFCTNPSSLVVFIGVTTVWSSPLFKRILVYFVCSDHIDTPMNDVK